ncbi:hypothetical protein HK097_008770 [Rhizophlyctis rosea]|uniref:F-box domain-containing protein n=1 Tax=Rhizophlyctis rosea TaxID=64517 RepID=A0AAD5SBF0_9FUNG|nr:hypothetical protein HK097_008770 [Rhizophlyctis rosea]
MEIEAIPRTDLCSLPPYHPATSINDLPIEILEHIFVHLEYEDQLPILPRTCRAFYTASKDMKHVTVVATSTALRVTLPNILSSYPRLESLYILAPPPTKNYATTDNISGISHRTHHQKLHALARQFTGHPNLKYIQCASDWVIPGALRCPKLQTLHLPFAQGHDGFDDWSNDADLDINPEDVVHFEHIPAEEPDTNDSEDVISPPPTPTTFMPLMPSQPFHLTFPTQGPAFLPFLPTLTQDRTALSLSRGRRNILTLLRQSPSLKFLTIDDPSIWIRPSTMRIFPPQPSSLTRLTINAISQWPLRQLLEFLNTDAAPTLFSNLQILKIDLDWLHLPPTAIPAFAKGLPNLQSLKLSHAICNADMILNVASSFPTLKAISWRQCDIIWNGGSWAAMIRYLTANILGLEEVGIKDCVLRNENTASGLVEFFEDLERRGSFMQHGLKKLVLFDTNETRPRVGDLKRFLGWFPELEVLRVDAPWDCLKEAVLREWTGDGKGLEKVNRLELKCARAYSAEGGAGGMNFSSGRITISEPLGKVPTEILPTVYELSGLRELTVSSPAELPLPFALTNLTTLVINFPSSSLPPNTPPYDLPNLKTLELRALSHHAHSLILSLLPAFTPNAPRLTSLHLDAIHHTSKPFPLHTLIDLSRSTSMLKHLHVAHFTFQPPEDHLNFLSKAESFPLLKTIRLSGSQALPMVLQCRSLDGFIRNHPHLKSVHVNVSGVMAVGREGEKVEMGGGGRRPSGIGRGEVYGEFGRRLKERFWWVRDVVVGGPRGVGEVEE